MKHHYITLCCLSIILLLQGCSATQQHVLSALEPASVDLATNITKIGIINESSGGARSNYSNHLEQLLSQRDQHLEMEGVDAAMNGLFEELQKDQRFEDIQLITTSAINTEGMTLTQRIPWQKIKEVCDNHGVDAIFSLAYYEADTQLSLKKKKIEEQNMMRQMVKMPGHEITLETLIENGWRIYDPYNQEVIDELVFNRQITSKAQGTNPLYALESITDRRDVILEQSTEAGSNYGKRLLPQERELIRDYYVRGSKKFVAAKELVANGDWKAAAVLWRQETTNDKLKVQAKACYNMAFYNEMNGKYELAMDWAEKATDLSKTKATNQYLNALKERIDQQAIVQQQLQRSHLSASAAME